MKKNKILKTALTFFAISTALSQTALASETNIGVVNTSVLFKDSALYSKFDEKFKKDYADRKEILLEDKAKITDLVADLKQERKAKRPSQNTIAGLEKRIKEKQADLIAKEANLNNELKIIMDNGRAVVLKHIQQKTTDFAKNKGYDVIIDTASAIYVSKAKDITKDVGDFMKQNTTDEEVTKIIEAQTAVEKEQLNKKQ